MSITLTLSTSNLADLNTFLESRSYFIGFAPTATDAQVLAALSGVSVDSSKFPNVARYVSHISSFADAARRKWSGGLNITSGGASAGAGTGAGAAAKPAAGGKPAAGKPAGGKAAAKKEAESSSDEDLFASSGDEAKKKKKAGAAKAAKAAAGAGKKDDGHKAAPVEKSQVVYDVKPATAGQDMADLERRIRGISLPGVSWGEQFKVVDVVAAYNIQKLVIQFVMVGEVTGLQDVEDAIMDLNSPRENEDDDYDIVQSVDLCTMNRL